MTTPSKSLLVSQIQILTFEQFNLRLRLRQQKRKTSTPTDVIGRKRPPRQKRYRHNGPRSPD